MASNPFYLYHGTLYKVPTSEKEHGHFHVDTATIQPAGAGAAIGSTPRPLHPKGGHNYYAGRDMEKLQRRLKSIAKDVAKGICHLVDTEQPYKSDSERSSSEKKETRPLDFFRRRRHSSSGPSRVSYHNLKSSSSSRELARTTTEEGHPNDTVMKGGLVASLTSGVFHRQTRDKAGIVNANNDLMVDADITSAELGQDACPNTTSPTSFLVEKSCPVPSRGLEAAEPPWVALYLAREQAEDQLWDEKLARSAWGALRGVVGFGAAGNAEDRTKDDMTGKTQTV